MDSEMWDELRLCWTQAPSESLRFCWGFCQGLSISVILSV